MRNYKALFILDTRGLETPVESQIEHLSNTIAEVGGEVKSAENLGRKDFSRVTDSDHPGDFFVQLQITAPTSAPAALQESLRLYKPVKRIFIESSV